MKLRTLLFRIKSGYKNTFFFSGRWFPWCTKFRIKCIHSCRHYFRKKLRDYPCHALEQTFEPQTCGLHNVWRLEFRTSNGYNALTWHFWLQKIRSMSTFWNARWTQFGICYIFDVDQRRSFFHFDGLLFENVLCHSRITGNNPLGTFSRPIFRNCKNPNNLNP